MCQRTAKLFLTDFLQTELYEGNVMLVKVNEMHPYNSQNMEKKNFHKKEKIWENASIRKLSVS